MLLAVDGGADALMDVGYRPNVIIGDMDSVSDEALQAGAELIVHAYPDGRAPGMARVRSLGLDAVPLPAPGTSEDIALLVADTLRRQPDRGRRQPLDAGGVPRQGPPGHGLDVPDPSAGRR